MGSPGVVCCLLSGRVVYPSSGTHTHLIKHVVWLLRETLSSSCQRVDLVYMQHPDLEVARSAMQSWAGSSPFLCLTAQPHTGDSDSHPMGPGGRWSYAASRVWNHPGCSPLLFNVRWYWVTRRDLSLVSLDMNLGCP